MGTTRRARMFRMVSSAHVMVACIKDREGMPGTRLRATNHCCLPLSPFCRFVSHCFFIFPKLGLDGQHAAAGCHGLCCSANWDRSGGAFLVYDLSISMALILLRLKLEGCYAAVWACHWLMIAHGKEPLQGKGCNQACLQQAYERVYRTKQLNTKFMSTAIQDQLLFLRF